MATGAVLSAAGVGGTTAFATTGWPALGSFAGRTGGELGAAAGPTGVGAGAGAIGLAAAGTVFVGDNVDGKTGTGAIGALAGEGTTGVTVGLGSGAAGLGTVAGGGTVGAAGAGA